MLQALPAIVEQHAEEAAFLWILRDRAVDAPNYKLHHLAQLERRIEAHLDGLRLAGQVGREIAAIQLDRFREPGELFTATVLALEGGDRCGLDAALDIAANTPTARRGLLGAIGWVSPHVLGSLAREWFGAHDAFRRHLGVVACSLHRVDANAHLIALIEDPDPAVRARAFRLAAEVGRVDLRERIARAGDAQDDIAGPWSIWAAALLGDPISARRLETVIEAGGPTGGPALEVVARRSEPERVAAWARRLNGNATQRRVLIQVLGALGDAAVLPWLLAQAEEPKLARSAGASIALISGVDIAEDGFESPPPQDFAAGPTEDAADEDVAMDPDEHLPWPNAKELTSWWDEHGAHFQRGTRYLLGQPVSDDAVEATLNSGYQNQRRAAAYERAVMHPEAGLPPWRRRAAAHAR
ncbi:MAG: TIGR02270 family protein [Geminicoccaceae bacterium]